MLQLINKNGINPLLFILLATFIPLVAATKTDNLLNAGFSYSYHSCEEGSVTIAFKDTSTTLDIASRLWEFGDGQTSTQKNPIFTFNSTQMLGVRLTITTADGNTETVTQTVDVQVIENIFIRENLLLCPGGSLPLNPDGNASYQYKWSPEAGLSDTAAANPLAAPSQTTTYSVTITNTAGSGTCEIVKQVEIFVPPAIPLSVTQDFSTCESTATLTVDTDPKYDINWIDSDGNKIGKGLEITITPNGRQTFFVEVIDEFGCSAKDAVTVTEVDPPVVSVTPSNPPCGIGNLGSAIATVTGGTGPYSYLWSNGLTGDTIKSLPLGNYVVTVTDANNCTAETTASIIEVPPVTVSIVADFDPCAIGPTELSLSVDPSTTGITNYEWMVNGTMFTDETLNLPVDTGETINVLVNITTEEGCEAMDEKSIDIKAFVAPELMDTTLCSGASLALNPTGNPDYVYIWSPAEGLSDPTTANPSVNAMESTDYMLTVTDGSCVHLDTLSLQVLQTPTLEAQGDTSLCSSSSVMISANTDSPDNLVWSLNPDFSDTLSLDPELVVTVLSTQNYFARVLGENGCSASDQVMIRLDSINIPTEASQRVCSGQPAQITAIADPQAQALSFSWTPANVITEGANTCCPTILATENVELLANITNDSTGCASALTVNVTVDDVESGLATADPPRIYGGESSQLNIENSDPTLNYIWEPSATLSNSNIQNPVASPSETTTYTVNIESPNEQCASTRTVTVTVIQCGEPFIFFPNAFSPNGDGENEILFLRANNVDNSRFVIFSRWGEQVFESRSINVGWDGTFEGEKVNPDVYGYFLEVTCANGEVFKKQGNVTLLK